MPLATREIKRRIRSIGNTKKITKAMELVSASKMRKAVRAVSATRNYATAAWEIVKDLSAKTDPERHSLLTKREKIAKLGVVMITANRGLCGGFNRELVETTAGYVTKQKSRHPGLEAEIFLMGKRGREIMFHHQHKIVAEFPKSDVAESVTEITALSKLILADYISGKYDKIAIAYTDYRSAISQQARIKQLLPIEKEDEELGSISSREPTQASLGQEFEFLFEPSPEAVLDQMLNRLIELQIFQALLESNASEHAARMMAMRNASDAAVDMINDLTLTFNQARQQTITAELADISAGRAAVT